jgi:putative thioredoxin
VDEAHRLIGAFPPSKEYRSVEKIRIVIEAVQRLASTPTLSDDPLEAAYNNSLRLILIGNIPAAMDGLLEVLRQKKTYRNQEPRQVMLGLFEILGDEDPLTRQYRNELALVLF